ncbi:MAG: pentapeptide repeat-containing protein [Nitrospinae bacterium]|nr:pentapeptide repeat-containing protein [Nitrospinota bacterium]
MAEHIKKHPIWYGIGLIALLSVLTWFLQNCPWCLWVWLRETPNGYESGSTTVRNLGLILAGLIALPLTLWRIRVADSQAKAAHQQVESSQDQVATSQRSLLNERYQKGAEMLGSEVLSVRLGGIFALARLAREHPMEYHVQIMRLFCAFVRNPIGDSEKGEEVTNEVESKSERGVRQKTTKKPDLRSDIQEIMTAIGKRSDAQIEIELQEKYKLDLHKANLPNADLGSANLSYANLADADLSGTSLVGADLSGGWLTNADLSNAELMRADLCNTRLIRAKLRGASLIAAKLFGTSLFMTDLSGARLSSVSGLTQEELDKACAEQENPPKLDSPYDAFESNYYEAEPPEQMIERLEIERHLPIDEQLFWRGKPLDE